MDEVLFEGALFGKAIRIVLYDVDKQFASKVLEMTYNEALRLQKIFNFYDKESELSRLNITRRLKVSDELKQVLDMALNICKITDGEYDITLGKSILQRKKGEKTDKVNCSYKDVKIKGNEVVLADPDLMIDLGSIAKGYITDKLADFLKSNGIKEGLIDSRGDIRVIGNASHILGVQNPRDKTRNICSIKIKNNCVATSGDYNQSFNDGSHILNQKNIISLTVLAPTLAEADAYATALFVCDDKKRKSLIEKNPDLKVFSVDNDMNVQMYNGFEKIISGVETWE